MTWKGSLKNLSSKRGDTNQKSLATADLQYIILNKTLFKIIQIISVI